ncbi:MAG: cell division protein ZapA [Clostridiales bacterium]|jgi:cell division protein ZapA|nr:cell division protein ZapA [Clostridiales bacterium]
MENKVDVVIGGEIITLKSSEQPDYLQRLARYADHKIEEIKAKSVMAAIDDNVRTLLIALNIADDYHKALDKFQRLDSLHKRLVHEVSKLQEENSALNEKVRKLEAELAKTSAELDEFIKSFDTENAPEGENILTLPPQQVRKAR